MHEVNDARIRRKKIKFSEKLRVARIEAEEHRLDNDNWLKTTYELFIKVLDVSLGEALGALSQVETAELEGREKKSVRHVSRFGCSGCFLFPLAPFFLQQSRKPSSKISCEESKYQASQRVCILLLMEYAGACVALHENGRGRAKLLFFESCGSLYPSRTSKELTIFRIRFPFFAAQRKGLWLDEVVSNMLTEVF